MSSIIVYTAIFGDRDILRTPIKFQGVKYVCFTDNPAIMSDEWEMIYVKATDEHPRRQAKKYKVCPHLFFPDHAYSIWVDATHIPFVHPAEMIENFLKRNSVTVALFAHSKRSCLYDEAKECIRQNLDDEHTIQNQISKYRGEKYPEKNGLATCTIIMRKHNHPKVTEAMDMWWREIEKHSMRDQISFNYVMHVLNLPFFLINQDIYNTPLFKRHHHIGTPEFYLEKHMEKPTPSPSLRPKKRSPFASFLYKKMMRVYILIDRNIGRAGIALNSLSPQAYRYLRVKFPKK